MLAPAIAVAKAGFPVTEIFADEWDATAGYLQRNPEAARVFLPSGRAPEVGEIFRNRDLARALEDIARDGRDAFYKGPVARRILDTSAKFGGTLAADDLAEFAPEWVEPISTDYRGWTVYEMPPNEQGIAALMMLNIVSGYPLGRWGHNSVATLHAMIEAKKLAYADMLAYVADPRFAEVPTKGMISAAYGKSRAALIDQGKANCNVGPGTPPYAGSDTTYLSTVDRDGNMVSLIQSNFSDWGSGIVVEGGGFVLHNRGALFTLEPGHPNVLAARKRPLHTIIPAMMTKGDIRIAFGIMGGFNQAQAHAQYVSNIVDHGMNIQAAMEAARFSKASFAGCDLYIEARVPATVLAGLAKLGHRLQNVGDFSGAVGGGQAVMRDDGGGRELRRLRSAQGRPGDRGNAGAAVTGGGPGEQRQLGKLAHNSIRSRRLRPMRRRSAKRRRIVGRRQYGGAVGALAANRLSYPRLRMRNTRTSPRFALPCSSSPVSLARWGMSISARGSVHSTISMAPAGRRDSALRVRSAGSGHLRPRKSIAISPACEATPPSPAGSAVPCSGAGGMDTLGSSRDAVGLRLSTDRIGCVKLPIGPA